MKFKIIPSKEIPGIKHNQVQAAFHLNNSKNSMSD